MGWRISTEMRNAMAAAFKDAAGSNAILRLYAGTRPASLTVPPLNTLLAEVVFSGVWLAAPVDGVLRLSALGFTDPFGNVGGVPGYGVLFKADGTTIIGDGEVSDYQGAGPLRLINPVITVGEAVSVVEVSFIMPAGS